MFALVTGKESQIETMRTETASAAMTELGVEEMKATNTKWYNNLQLLVSLVVHFDNIIRQSLPSCTYGYMPVILSLLEHLFL